MTERRRVAAAACQRLCSTACWRWWPPACLRPGMCSRRRLRPAARQVRWGGRWCCCIPCRWWRGGGSPGRCWPSGGSGLVFTALDLPPGDIGVAILVAVYSVAAYGSWWVALAGLGGVEVALVAVQLTPGRTGVGTLVGNLGCGGGLAVGSLRPQLSCLRRPAGGADHRAGAGPRGAGPPGGRRSGCAWPASSMTWLPTP